MTEKYSVITHVGDGVDHETLDTTILGAFRDKARVTGFPALCGVWIVPETDPTHRNGVRCVDCRNARAACDPPLTPRTGPRRLAREMAEPDPPSASGVSTCRCGLPLTPPSHLS